MNHLRHTDDLYASAVDVKPVDRDWGEGFGDTWESYEAPECGSCGHYARWAELNGALTEEGHAWRCQSEDCERYGEEIDLFEGGAEGPMMSYAYALPGYDGVLHEAADAIRDLPLCVVWRGGAVELALTGGGMDLSWEICEAYVRLGYLPPKHFAADPPRLAGHTPKPEVVAACRRSLLVAAAQAERGLERLSEYQ